MITTAHHRRPPRTRPPGWWLAQGLKRVLPLLALCTSAFSLQPSAFASIITGNLQTTSGNPYVTNALFAPLSTPLASGASVIASTQTNVVAAANGDFSVTLKQGNYLVTIGNLRHDSFVISVPNDSNTYNLNSLITNALTFNYTYSPTYEQRVNKGQADGYVGLSGTLLTPSGLSASNFTFLFTINLGVDATRYATFYINQNSSLFVQSGGALTLSGDSSPRAELFLHGTNAFLRFDEDAAINDSTASKIWKFNKFNITSNNVATLGEVTNIHSQVFQAAKTASYTISALESGTYFNNSLSGALITNTLPASVPGQHYYFVCMVATNIAALASGTDTIRNAGGVSAAGGLIFSSTVGSVVHLFCPVAGKWYVDILNGPWTLQ